jgi:poly(hydroxyalkanoate) depolymerase family esterase
MLQWLRRVGAWAARILRRPPRPGRWIEGHATSLHGIVWFRPWVLPRRRFRLYLPHGFSLRTRAPLVTLLHGCRQTPEVFAQGTRIEAAADQLGALVLMPDQKDSANPLRCWNWFDSRTAHGNGEAAIVAAAIRKVSRRYRADPSRVVAAGISAGAALAAVMGVRYPELVRGVFSHSGIACGAATSALTALSVMGRGPESDVAAIAREAREGAGTEAPVALLAVQGGVDNMVAARNAAGLARQYLALNRIAVPDGSPTSLPPPDRDDHDRTDPLRVVRTREWQRDGRTIVRLVEVDRLGHAWSGGDPAVPFNDAESPDATGMLCDLVGTLAR